MTQVLDDAQPREEYPALREELELLERELEPAFRTTDREALRCQRWFRAMEVTLIAGSVVAVALGAGALGQEGPPPAGLRDGLLMAEGVLTAALTFVAYLLRHFRWHPRWLRLRAAAESLRGERYLFLARTGPYREAENRLRTLRTRVAGIQQEGLARPADEGRGEE